jgi:hypothetical protein
MEQIEQTVDQLFEESDKRIFEILGRIAAQATYVIA